jgi:hypothetical protein
MPKVNYISYIQCDRQIKTMFGAAKSIEQVPLTRIELRRDGRVMQMLGLAKDLEKLAVGRAEAIGGKLFARRLSRSAKKSGRSIVGFIAEELLA